MNKITFLFKVASILIFCATMAVLYVLFPDRLMGDKYLLFSALVLSFALACIGYIPMPGRKGESTDGWLSSLGIQGVFLFIFIVVSATAFSFNLLGSRTFSLALDILAITVFMMMLIFSAFTSRHTDSVSAKLNFNGRQNIWAQRLEVISLSCEDTQLRSEIEKKAAECRYLARDIGVTQCEISYEIDGIVESLSHLIAKSDFESARSELNKYSHMISRRELSLKMQRKKA